MKRLMIVVGLLLLFIIGGISRWLSKPPEAPKVAKAKQEVKVTSPEIDHFNSFGATLKIELSIPAQQVSPKLLNKKADPAAKITSVKLIPEVYDKASDKFRPLTEAESKAVALRAPEIRLRGESDRVVTCKAPNGEFFTVQDLFLAIEETERQTRGESEWLGSIDVHHIFFEGIGQDSDGVWFIRWGS